MVGEESPEGEPVYVDLADALELYAAIIGGTVTQAGDHLRNRGGLESGLARPQAYAHYKNADLALQASALAHGIAESQTFVDANKRLALVAMLTFIEINDLAVVARPGLLGDDRQGRKSGSRVDFLAPFGALVRSSRTHNAGNRHEHRVRRDLALARSCLHDRHRVDEFKSACL